MSPTLTDDETNLLKWAFTENHRFLAWLENKVEVPTYIWFNYTDVLSNIADLPIRGIQEKLAQIGKPEDLLPILSELKAAKVFAARNFEVELLLNNDKRFKQPPDLFIKRRELQLLVEVQRKLGDYDIEFNLHQQLSPLLEERDFTLSIFYSEDLSELAVDYCEREKKYKKFSGFAEKMRQRLELLNQDELPCSFELDGSNISIKAAEPGWGRFSFCATSATIVPDEKYTQQIRTAVQKKASKRSSWKSDYLAIPFLIFLDLETVELSEATFSALYGSRTQIDWLESDELGPQRIAYPQFVIDELKSNQQELLSKLGFDSRRHIYVDDPGIFVTEESVKRNATGVVTMFNGKVECLPNPFCDKLIWLSELPEYLGIPLTSFAGMD